MIHADFGFGRLDRRQILDLLDRIFPGLASRQATVDRDPAAVRHRAARRGSMEDFRNGQRTFAEEIMVEQVFVQRA